MECPSCDTLLLTLTTHCSHCGADPLAFYQCQQPNCLHIQPLAPSCTQCNHTLAGPLTGKRLSSGDSCYNVRELLGGGGMGEVYRSIEENHAGGYLREVAIKLNKEITTPERQERFRREVQTLIKLNNPHNTRVYGYGEQRDNDVLVAQFMAMELLHGVTLEGSLEDHPLPLQDALAVYRQIGRALSEAHQKGVIHRDLKPSNIKLINPADDPPFAKLFDYGLSKHTQPDSQPISTSGVIMGTLWYMSPEQARGDRIDQRSDIFSMGVILYQMLTKQLPFPAQNLYQIYQLHPHGPPTLPDDLDPNLQELLDRSLAYDPNDRFNHLHECLALLPSIDPDRVPPSLASGEFGPPVFSRQTPPPRSTPPPLSTPSSRSNPPHSALGFDDPSIELHGEAKVTPVTHAPFVSARLLWGLLILIAISSSVAFFFLWRAKNPTAKPKAFGLTLPAAINRNRIIPPRRPKQKQPPQRVQPAPRPPNKRVRPRPPRRVEPQPRTRPKPVLRRRNVPAIRRRTFRRRLPIRRPRVASKTQVQLKLTPSCDALYLLRKGRRYRQDDEETLRLKPGTHKLLCVSPEKHFRRVFTIKVKRRLRSQTIERTWRRVTVKILFRPWGFPSVDGFKLRSTQGKACQFGCFARLWEGTNKLVLRRPIEGTAQNAVVLRRTLNIADNLQQRPLPKRTFKIRWNDKKQRLQ